MVSRPWTLTRVSFAWETPSPWNSAVNLELDGLLNNEVTRGNLSHSVYDICQELKIAVVRMNCSLLVMIQDLQDFHVALTSLVCGLYDAGENFMGANREECMSIFYSDM